MHSIRLVITFLFSIVLAACSEDAPKQSASKTQSSPAATSTTSQTASSSDQAVDVTVRILPENPNATGCLRAIIQGVPGVNDVVWRVNDEVVASGSDTQLCSDGYKRGDTVSVTVGTRDKGAQETVTIENSPPRVVDIASEAVDVFAGAGTTIVPVAEDTDGDDVDFSYQWVINGEENPLLVEATLPGDSYKKGDTVQVLIVPNDFYDDGPTYESTVMVILNAAPRITSVPPEGITSIDYLYQVEVNDPDDNQFTYRLDEAPDGMAIDKFTGLIHWSLVDVTPGDYKIAIIATDPDDAEGAQEYKLTLGEPQ
jgi:hypothetical protein